MLQQELQVLQERPVMQAGMEVTVPQAISTTKKMLVQAAAAAAAVEQLPEATAAMHPETSLLRTTVH